MYIMTYGLKEITFTQKGHLIKLYAVIISFEKTLFKKQAISALVLIFLFRRLFSQGQVVSLAVQRLCPIPILNTNVNQKITP